VEDPIGLPFAPPRLMAFWSLTSAANRLQPALAALRGHGYTTFKAWSVTGALPPAADLAAERQSRRPYLVFTNNCLDAVHKVLTAYGARHPHIHDPSELRSWIPNLWFDRIPFEPLPLDSLEANLNHAG